MRYRHLCVVICGLWVLPGQRAAFAGTVVDPYVKTYVFYCFDTSDCLGANAHFPAVDGPKPAGPASVSVPTTTLTAADSAQLVYSGAAWTQFGTFGVFSSGQLSNGDPTKSYSTDALAQFGEKLTINDPAHTGQSGMLAVSVTVNGQMMGDARANIVLIDSNLVDIHGNPVGTTVDVNGPTTIHYAPVPFTFGTPFNLTFQFFATVGLSGVTSFNGDGFFLDTATITGLGVYDQTSTLDQVATFSAASGTQYTSSGLVPEPGGLELMAAGILLWRLGRMAGWGGRKESTIAHAPFPLLSRGRARVVRARTVPDRGSASE